MTTMDKVLSLLRRETLTVGELIKRLNVTRNAVIVPLRHLESKGLVRGQIRSEARVGKPALEYTAVPGREDEQSLAYPAFATLLVQSLTERMNREEISELMNRVGQKMAKDLEVKHRAGFSDRLKAATDFADRLGAETKVTVTPEGATIVSYSCPLGRAVRVEPCVCSAMETFFAKVTKAEVKECCDRDKKLICKFVVKKKPRKRVKAEP